MPRESADTKAARARKIIALLRKTYPDAHCELKFSNPLELLVATILSAQCTDKRVNLVTKELFKKYRSAADYVRAEQSDMEQDIKTAGFYRNKARSIKRCCQAIVERHAGRVPDTLEALIQLDGVGRKTANVVLGNAFDINVGVVVDTHVTRLSRRLGFTQETHPAKIEAALMKLSPRTEWALLSHLLIWHGRRRCTARKPDCAHCEISSLCPSAGKVETKRNARREA